MPNHYDSSNISEISLDGVDPRASTARLGIDHEQVRSCERVMAELLLASQMNRVKRLSRLAESALAQEGHDSSIAGYRATAQALRSRCVKLGMPECRYRDSDWRARGL